MILEIGATDTHPLRRLVLRDGNMTADVRFPEDDNARAFHLGAFERSALIGVASFSPAQTPYRESQTAWQLRGMAVNNAHQGQGVGAQLVAAAVERVRADGASVLWCNARDTAATFYEKLGFVTCGEGFVTKTTGLPHHVMVLDL